MKKILLLLVAVLGTTTMWAEDYITDVMVIGGSKTETNNLKASYEEQGWTVIDQDLNAGCGSGSDYIYLLYKKASDSNSSVGTFISDFIVSTATGTIPDNLTHNGYTYNLVPFDGSDYFKNNKGDLNSHCGSSSATIHLYFTKQYDLDGKDYSTVKSISFNNTQSGAVTTTDGSTGYDLNTGCGSGSDYIYMHADKAKGWSIVKNTAGTQCYINGFDGPKKSFTELIIPTAIDGATVLGFSMTFSEFTNLETMIFAHSSSVAQMPSVQGCSKFYNIKTTIYNSGNFTTPPSMTSIPGHALAGTAIEQIKFTSVTNVGSDVFYGSNKLSSVTFNTSPVLIENGGFSNIISNCQVSYPGSIEDWSPTMYMFSPNLIIKNGTSWSCGWCGGTDDNSYNYLYWTLNNANLKISSYGDLWETYPDKQLITTHNWIGQSINSITLEKVYSIRQGEFDLYDLKDVYVDATLHSIGKEVFYGCAELENFWFDGNQSQWDAVSKDSQWKNGANNFKEHWHCTVTFNANGHGTAPAPQNIEWSNQDKATEPAAPTAEGYYFTGWYTDAECSTPWFFDDVVPGDMTLYAGWNPEAATVLGDVNGDGEVTSADVTCIYNYLLNGDDTFIDTCDVNGDGNITSVDITIIYNILLGSN